MSKEDLIAMAKTSGFAKPSLAIGVDGKARSVLHFRPDKLESFASLVAARTREECAKSWTDAHGFDKHGVAAFIRAMGERT